MTTFWFTLLLSTAVVETASVFSQLHFCVNTKNGIKWFRHAKGGEKRKKKM